MTLIVGLGNPGSKYRGTRHNVGFEVIDRLAERLGLGFESCPADAVLARERGPGARLMLAKPLTYMNRSGGAVQALRHYYRIEPEALLVVADDVNLPLSASCGPARGGRTAATTGSGRSSSRWEPSGSRGCGSASAGATSVAIWPGTCWRASRSRSARWSTRRWIAPPTQSRRLSPTELIP